jgi:hypothetical protein
MITVLDGGTDQPIDGFEDLDLTSIDISSIDPKSYPTIILEAVLTSEGPFTPLLNEWSVTWKTDLPQQIDDIPSDWNFLEDTDADNLIDLSVYFEDIWTTNAHLKFKIIYESDNTHIDATVDGKYLDFTTPTINWSGSEMFKIKCTDEGGLSVDSNEFKVTVTEVNDAPAWTPIGYIHISEDTNLIDIVELDSYIIDTDDSLKNISYSLISNNNEENIFVQIDKRIVYVEPLFDNYVGSAIVKVRAEDGQEETDTTFTIIIDPVNDKPVVELLSPGNNMIITTGSVKLSWSEGFDVDGTVVSYDVYLDEVSPPQTLISNDQTVTSFSKDLEDGTYYWTVIAYDGFIEGEMVEDKIWSFTVSTGEEPTTPPPKIELKTPYDNSIINTGAIDLIWNSNRSYSDIKYFVYFDTEPVPNKIVATGITETKYTITNLTDGVTYYWTVIPVSGSLLGSCKNGVWSFRVQSDFIPNYGVDITGTKIVVINQSETLSINLTVKNNGNVNDIFRPELETEKFGNYIGFYDSRDILLEPEASTQLQIIISIPEDGSPGNFNISVKVTSFWGGSSVYDTQKVQVKVNSKTKTKDESEQDSEDEIEMGVWILLIVIIIIILIAIAFVFKKQQVRIDNIPSRKRIKEPDEKVLLPDVIRPGGRSQALPPKGGSGVRVLTPSAPMLQTGVGPTSASPHIQSVSPQIASSPTIPSLPSAPEQVTTTIVPPPRRIIQSGSSQQYQRTALRTDGDMSLEEKLKLLDERLLKGEIDQKLYEKLRREFEVHNRF